jgi:hypothetical protein
MSRTSPKEAPFSSDPTSYYSRVALQAPSSSAQYDTNDSSVVGIMTGYGLQDREVGVRVPVGSRIFSSPRRPDRLWGPPNLHLMGTGDSFPGGKRLGREADHTLPTNVEVKKTRIYTSTPPYAFMA